MEDREEKADYPTVVVHGLEIQEKRACVRSLGKATPKETAAVSRVLIFETETCAFKKRSI